MEIVLRATVIFLFLLLFTRGLRKRVLAEMSPFEMIVLVTVGDLVQQGITQEDYSLTGAVLAVSTIGAWASALTWLTWRSRRLRRAIEGVPVVLVSDGRPVDETLRVEQMPLEEVLEAARQQGIERLDQIRLAVLEVSGKISIIAVS